MRTYIGVLSASVLLTAASSIALGSQWNKLTRLTVHEPIGIPGTVLSPGEYVVKLVDSQSNRHIVRFLNEDQSKVLATVLAVPNKRMRPSGNTQLGFYETPIGEPVALRSWFYPGDTIGQEFVYPERQARQISARSKRHVPTTEDSFESQIRDGSATADSDPPPDFARVRIYTWTPSGGRLESPDAGFTENEKLDAGASRSQTRRYAEFSERGARARTTDRAKTRIAREVRHELVMLPYYGVFDNLAYRVDGGTVTLMGQVTRPTLKSSAENVVKNIEGVERVQNEITVLPVSPADDRLRMAAYQAIYGHTALNRYALQAVPPIHILVNNGHVTLEGSVASEADKNIAAVQARSVSGVFSVNNNLRVDGGRG